MPETVRLQVTATVDGESYAHSYTATGDTLIRISPSLAAAKTGTLTTRTDNNTGTLTMQSGHGITTGAKLDVYWDGGSRYNMTVGTVSGTSVPIDLGGGDNLPTASTAITAMVPEEHDCYVANGTNVVMVVGYCSKAAYVVFKDDGGNVISGGALQIDAANAESWIDGGPGTNPITGSLVQTVALSHGDSTAARTVTAIVVPEVVS